MNKKDRFEIIMISLFWIAYSLLCIYFYAERSTYADNSYYIFTIIQKQTFCLQHERYGAVFTQWLPVLAVKSGCSLKTVLMAFSICPVIFYLILFLIIRKISQEKWISYIFLLSITTTIHHSFFIINAEMVHGSALLIVLAAMLRSDKLTPFRKAVSTIVIIAILTFMHIFLIAIALLIIVISFLQKPSKKLIIIAALTILLLIVKKLIITDGYESHAFQFFNWKAITLKNIHSSFFPGFFFNSIFVYFQLAVFFAMVLFIKSELNKKLVIALVISIIALYITLMLFLRNGTMKAYADSYNAIVFYFVWAILVLIIKDEMINKRWNVFLVVIFIFSIGRIFTERAYSDRIHYLQHLMKDNQTKQIYLYKNMPEDIKSMCWSVPYETLIISTLSPPTKTILVKEEFYQINDYLLDSTKFLGAEWSFSSKIKLNERYFRLKKELYVLKE